MFMLALYLPQTSFTGEYSNQESVKFNNILVSYILAGRKPHNVKASEAPKVCCRVAFSMIEEIKSKDSQIAANFGSALLSLKVNSLHPSIPSLLMKISL